MQVPFLDLKIQYQKLKREIEKAVCQVLASGVYIGGAHVQEFEEKMGTFLGMRYAISCGNGTEALVLALRACGIGQGDEVITTPFTFFATAEAIACIGAIPVFADINDSDFTINPQAIEEKITGKTKAILPVHIFGAPCDMEKILEIANAHQLRVVEDCAQAVGSEYKGKKVGSLGDAGCFSFYPTKNLGAFGDGGMVVTNQDEISIIVKALKEHGAGEVGAIAFQYLYGDHAEINLKEEKTNLYNPYKYFNYLVGYNSRLDALQACILSIKIQYLQEFNQRREKIAQMYLAGLDDFILRPRYSDINKICWHQFAIRTDYKMELCQYLTENKIGYGTFYPVPLHRQKAFAELCKNVHLPIAEKVCEQTVCLPIYPELTDEQVGYVIDRVNSFYKDKA